MKSRENIHRKAGRSWCLASGGLDATVVFWQRSGRGEIDLGSKKIVVEDDAWMSQEVSKWLINGLYNLLINGVYWSYNQTTNLLLTSWDIQVVGSWVGG